MRTWPASCGYLPIPDRILPRIPGRCGWCSAVARDTTDRPSTRSCTPVELTAQFERAPVQDRAVEPRLLGHLLPRLVLRAFAGLGHIPYLQVLSKHDRVVFADVVRGLV